MEHTDITQAAMTAIRTERIRPHSRIRVMLLRALRWGVTGAVLLIGALAFAVILYVVLHTDDWDLVERYGIGMAFRMIPYFWVIALVLFVVVGEFSYRRTLFGHRYRITWIIGIYLLLTGVLGSGFYALGLGNQIDELLADRIPLYRHYADTKSVMWNQPERGLLSGRIISEAAGTFILRRSDESEWTIGSDGAVIRGGVSLLPGVEIKIIGTVVGERMFRADEIRPWQGRGEASGGRSRGLGSPLR